MQHHLELGGHYYHPEAHPDHRSHRYRSFMIEEILTDHHNHKVAAPAGELLKFGVQALLSARPYHNHLGKCIPVICSGLMHTCLPRSVACLEML